ncbi:MAG: ATP-dependent DNA helicase RecQ, partial [Planctomycetota bacterium]
LSSVFRQDQRFGGDYTALVLKGSLEQRIVQNGHDKLSTHGLLKEVAQKTIRDWIEQLVGQGFLKKDGEFNLLKITADGWKLLKGEATPKLLKPAMATSKERKRAAVIADSWDGVDRGLFDALRELRHAKAAALSVPAYIVFGDTALRDMARRRPTTMSGFRSVKGVGDKKLADFGADFIACITRYCEKQQITTDTAPPDPNNRVTAAPSESNDEGGPTLSARAAFRRASRFKRLPTPCRARFRRSPATSANSFGMTESLTPRRGCRPN